MSSFKAVIAAKKKLKLAEAAARKATEAEAGPIDPLEHTAASPAAAPAGSYPPQLPKTPAGPPGSHLPPMPTMGTVAAATGSPGDSPNADLNRSKLKKKRNLLSSLNRLEGVIHRSNTLVGAPPMVPGKLSAAEIEKGNADPKAALQDSRSAVEVRARNTFPRAPAQSSRPSGCGTLTVSVPWGVAMSSPGMGSAPFAALGRRRPPSATATSSCPRLGGRRTAPTHG